MNHCITAGLLAAAVMTMPFHTQAADAGDPQATPAAAADGLLDPMPETPAAPDFELQGPDGETYSLAAMQGQPVIINFWATWCPPCRAEMPAMQRAWEQLEGDGVMLVAVNVGESKAEVAAFAEQLQVEFPLPMDTDMSVSQRWPMKGLPTTFVVDPDGRLVYRAQGERDWDDPALLDLVRGLRQQ
ncbi:MAG: TlpA disulfide reductase family protein [Thiohalocapsa sp.]